MTDHDKRPIDLAPGGGVTIENPVGGPLTFKVRADQTNGALTVVESTAPPGEGPPLHVHANEDEALYTLEGTLRFRLGDEVQAAPAGAFAFIPRGTPHTWQNVGEAPARLLVIFTPAAAGWSGSSSDSRSSARMTRGWRRSGDSQGRQPRTSSARRSPNRTPSSSRSVTADQASLYEASVAG